MVQTHPKPSSSFWFPEIQQSLSSAGPCSQIFFPCWEKEAEEGKEGERSEERVECGRKTGEKIIIKVISRGKKLIKEGRAEDRRECSWEKTIWNSCVNFKVELIEN